jgi:hypothetical protein
VGLQAARYRGAPALEIHQPALTHHRLVLIARPPEELDLALNQPEGENGTVECLYERVRARLLAEPERYAWRYILVATLLTRR